MERVTVDELLAEVKVTIDESRDESGCLEDDTDHLELDGIIRSKLLDAIVSVTGSAPVHLLDAVPMEIPEAAHYMETGGSGYVVLPPDFFRLVLFKMRSWRVPVYDMVSCDSDIAGQQKSLFTCGNPLRPVCVLSKDLAGNNTLEYYSVGYMNNGEYNRRDHRIERALYIRYPEYVEEEGILKVDISKRLREAIVNYCAGLVMSSRGNAGEADIFFKLSKSYLE